MDERTQVPVVTALVPQVGSQELDGLLPEVVDGGGAGCEPTAPRV
jgi:hypothetical protein